MYEVKFLRKKGDLGFLFNMGDNVSLINRYDIVTKLPQPIYKIGFFWFFRLVKIKEWVDKNDPGAIIIPFSGALEQKLIEMEDPELAKKYLEDNKVTR